MKCPNVSFKTIGWWCFSLAFLCLGFGGLGTYSAVAQALPVEISVMAPVPNVEFSARLVWRIGKRSSKAQLFVKGDRYRIEHLAGIKTDLGYATVTIVRLDQQLCAIIDR